MKYFNKKLARCGIRCELTSMQNTTSAETGTAQASRPDLSPGDKAAIKFNYIFGIQKNDECTVEIVRQRVCGKWEAYVIFEGKGMWIIPIDKLKKIASGK